MRRIALFVLLAGFLMPVLASAPAYAQATRTWVSGTGDDNNTVNGCSRTAPCKTFTAAISVTATNGEINCLSPGDYGSLNIRKSITIDCTGTSGLILTAGFGITINLDTTPDPLQSVVVRGLSINGTGSGGRSGGRGVNIISAAVVTLENMEILHHLQYGVSDSRTSPGKLFIKNSVMKDNGKVGIALAVMTGGTNMVSIENTHSIDTLYGLAAGSGNQIKITRSVFSGNSVAGIEADGGAQVGVEHSTVNFNGIGLQANGTIWIDDTDISFNQSATQGVPISFGNNRFYANVNPPGALSAGPASTDRGQN
jgi:hypothetical protein